MTQAEKPKWNSDAPAASLRRWAEYLHGQAKATFREHGTQPHIIFYFTAEKGVVAVVPVPSNTAPETVNATTRRAIGDRHLYAVISIGEAWVYLHKPGYDHTAFQIRDGEIKVGDLRDADKSEHLYVRMESRDGECVVIMDAILRGGGRPALGESRTLVGEEMRWFGENHAR